MNSVTDMLTQTSDHYNSKKKERNMKVWITMGIRNETNDLLIKMATNYSLPKNKTLEIIIKSAYKEMITSPKEAMKRGDKIEKSINDFISKK